jgi:glycosyltransferase involved in cell wall biosynthesis
VDVGETCPENSRDVEEEMSHKHIAFFIPSLERGGVERTLVNLLRGFIGQGYGADLLVVHVREEFLKKVPEGVRVVRLGSAVQLPSLKGLIPPRMRTALTAFPGLIYYLREERPGVIISFQASVVAVWACKLTSPCTRLIIREYSTPSAALSEDKRFIARIVPLLKKWSYQKAGAIIANSYGAAEDLARVLRLPKQKIHVIYNPTYDDSILELAKEPVEHPWFEPGEPPVVLSVGRLTSYQKDYRTLLHAFAQVRRELYCRLVILGEGEERKGIEALAETLGIGEDIDLPGFVENPYKYMARASVFVLSSRSEGLPNVLIEALVCGVPVVSTDCPSGPREILLDGLGGLLVPIGNVEAMAGAIKRLLRDQEFARSLLQYARKHLDRFRPEVCFKSYLAIVEGKEQ